MIHDDTPHRIFKISELTRLIASQLVLIDQKGTANLARACRCLEEPALSVLWETQWSLYTLLEVLPEENLEPHRIAASTCVVRDLDLGLLDKSNAQAQDYADRNRGGSITRGLEQSLALRVLDASSHDG